MLTHEELTKKMMTNSEVKDEYCKIAFKTTVRWRSKKQSNGVQNDRSVAFKKT